MDLNLKVGDRVRSNIEGEGVIDKVDPGAGGKYRVIFKGGPLWYYDNLTCNVDPKDKITLIKPFKVGDLVKLKDKYWEEPEFDSLKAKVIAGDVTARDARDYRKAVSTMFGKTLEISSENEYHAGHWFVKGCNRSIHESLLELIKRPVEKKEEKQAEPKYREVERMAKVGEKIKVVKPAFTGGEYKQDDVFTVSFTNQDGIKVKEHGIPLLHKEYVVFEPITDNAEPVKAEASKVSGTLGVSGKYGIVGTPTKMVDKNGNALFVGDVVSVKDGLCGFEYSPAYVVLNEKRAFVMGIMSECKDDGKIVEWIIERVKKFTELTDGEEHGSIKFKAEAPKPFAYSQEVIAKAKCDIWDMESELEDMGRFPFSTAKGDAVMVDIISLTEQKNLNGRFEEKGLVVASGKAKCNPSDTFNLAIGQAIALRRAMGKEIPDEYLQKG